MVNTAWGLLEVYELSGNTSERSRLVNLSTRCLVGTGEDQPIASAIVRDVSDSGCPANHPELCAPDRRVLIFGKGPSLAVSTPLNDPKIQVLNTGDTSDNYGELNSNLIDELDEATLLPTNSKESALWPTWRPGTYSVTLSSVDGSQGIGLIEFYEY